MQTTVEAPKAAAARRSLCRAMRLRSRHVICTTGRWPCARNEGTRPIGDIVMTALDDSVRLIASTTPRRCSVRRSSPVRSVPLGGDSSVVTRNRPEARTLSKPSSLSGPGLFRPVAVATLSEPASSVDCRIRPHCRPVPRVKAAPLGRMRSHRRDCTCFAYVCRPFAREFLVPTEMGPCRAFYLAVREPVALPGFADRRC